jgi:hypothetical protein
MVCLTSAAKGHGEERNMTLVLLGIVLLIVGLVLGIGALSTIGTVLLVIGAVVWIADAVGGRRW